MHIASGLTLVRRAPAQSDIATGRTTRRAPEQPDGIRVRLRKILPGAILLAVLVVLGALFPILF